MQACRANPRLYRRGDAEAEIASLRERMARAEAERDALRERLERAEGIILSSVFRYGKHWRVRLGTTYLGHIPTQEAAEAWVRSNYGLDAAPAPSVASTPDVRT